MIPFLIVFIASGLGGAMRYGVNLFVTTLLPGSFPAGTITINITGSLAMGLLAELFLLRAGFSQDTKIFWTTGIIGGYTTFSTFALNAVTLWSRGEDVTAIVYVVASVIVAVLSLAGGMALVRVVSG